MSKDTNTTNTEVDTISDMDAAWEQAQAAVGSTDEVEETNSEPNGDESSQSETEEQANESAESKDGISDVEELEKATELKKLKQEPEDEESPEDTSEDKYKQLQELASELGYDFNGEAVQNSDWVKLRKQSKARDERFAAKAEEKAQEIRQAKAELEAKYRPYEDLRAAVESGDMDQMAKLVGFRDFNHMQMGHINGSTTEATQLAKLKRELEESKSAQTKYAEEQKAQAQAAQQEAALTQYKAGVSKTLSEYQETAALASDHRVVDAILHIQQESLNAAGEITVSVEEAAASVLTQLNAEYDNMAKILNRQQQASEGAAGEAPPKVTEKKPKKTVPNARKSDASSTSDSDELDEKAWLEKWTK